MIVLRAFVMNAAITEPNVGRKIVGLARNRARRPCAPPSPPAGLDSRKTTTSLAQT